MLDERFDKSGSVRIILLVYSAGKISFNFGGDGKANYIYSSIFFTSCELPFIGYTEIFECNIQI
jgi:hypothetical protein